MLEHQTIAIKWEGVWTILNLPAIVKGDMIVCKMANGEEYEVVLPGAPLRHLEPGVRVIDLGE